MGRVPKVGPEHTLRISKGWVGRWVVMVRGEQCICQCPPPHSYPIGSLFPHTLPPIDPEQSNCYGIALEKGFRSGSLVG